MDRNWWKERVIYQIYPRSFKDSNNDGVGDIRGIIEKLDLLKSLGIGIIWFSPLYKSPNYDNGYDIADYTDIHPEYGTMKEMDLLLEEAKKRDIKIVMDLVINHTSNEHEWFEKSRNRVEPYTDYYYWRDGKDGKNPNNWTSFFGEDAWEYDEVRKQYYLHLFAKQQPDLNYYNPNVLKEIKKVIKFWLDKGVSGFRCDVINIIYKTSLEDGKKQIALKGLEHYLSQEGNHKILKEIRKDVLDNYDCFTVGETVLVDPKMAKDLCSKESKELDMIFSFEHMEADQYYVKWFKRKFSPKRFFTTLSKWQKELDWNANYFENHDQLRSVSRFGDEGFYWKESAKMLSTLLLSLKGTPFIYQGQEIGMTNFDFKSFDDIEDVESRNINALLKSWHIPKWYRWKFIKRSSRDNVRTPLQWENKAHGGFTDGTPWLKVNDNYSTINYASQIKDSESIWSFYKEMINYRKDSEVLLYGEFKDLIITKKVYVFERFIDNEKLIIAVNFSKKTLVIPYTGKVEISNYDGIDFNGTLKPYQSVIMKG